MLQINFIKYVKIVVITWVMTVMAGCGGGRATTSTDNGTDVVPIATGSTQISWQAPTTYSDNTPLTELAGHNIYMNDGTGYTKIISLDNPGVLTYVVENLVEGGTYSFIVTAVDVNGLESGYSNELSVTI